MATNAATLYRANDENAARGSNAAIETAAKPLTRFRVVKFSWLDTADFWAISRDQGPPCL